MHQQLQLLPQFLGQLMRYVSHLQFIRFCQSAFDLTMLGKSRHCILCRIFSICYRCNQIYRRANLVFLCPLPLREPGIDTSVFRFLLDSSIYMGMISLLIQVYFKATDPFNERWQSAWIITAFWDILAFALLCVICYLWAPSQSSQRYVKYVVERGRNIKGFFLYKRIMD